MKRNQEWRGGGLQPPPTMLTMVSLALALDFILGLHLRQTPKRTLVNKPDYIPSFLCAQRLKLKTKTQPFHVSLFDLNINVSYAI